MADPFGVTTPSLPPRIRDHALVGDCHGAALVTIDGTVDWLCLDRFDSDPVLFSLLDAHKGGRLELRAPPLARFEQSYETGTNVVCTRILTAGGEARCIDFMPVGRQEDAGANGYVHLGAPGWFVRVVEGIFGEVPLELAWRPSAGFGQPFVEIARRGRSVVSSAACLTSDVPLEIGPADAAPEGRNVQEARATMRLAAGERRRFVVARRALASAEIDAAVDRWLDVTRAFWSEWACYCRYDGPHAQTVLRSALALKLLTYAPTGALVAAPTSSLPEEIGGKRNYDYRYCWLRDSALTLYALAALGYSGEARRFSAFFQRIVTESQPDLQVLYGVEGERAVGEKDWPDLDGYRHSRPVRTGNGAVDQLQLDIYGAVLDWAWLYDQMGGKIEGGMERALRRLADFVQEHWMDPEAGIWEMRGDPRQHVFGKLMCWVALDRAQRLLGNDERRAATREKIWSTVMQRGRRGDRLVQVLDGTSEDAALLLVPTLGLPLGRETLEATVRAIEERLGSGEFLRRYLVDDGLEGGEGAFLACSFWLVDALLHCDRGDDARALFDRLCARANHVGLFSEEIDPDTGDFLGNFPQALTHMALVQSATHLEAWRAGGRSALEGTHADRARRIVGAVSGPRALWEALRRSGKICRILSSRASKVPAEHAAAGAAGR